MHENNQENDMELGISFSDPAIESLVAVARLAEDHGVGSLSVGDSKYGADSFTLLAALAAMTERVQLVSAIAGWTRTPTTTAHIAHTISALSKGRLTVGIGPLPRERIEEWHGNTFDPVIPRMREYIGTLIHCLEATEASPTDIDGEYYRSHGYVGPSFDRYRRTPVILAATQPAMTRLAGEVADGVIFNGMVPRAYIQGAGRDYLAEGAARSGRSLDGFSISAGRLSGVHDSRTRAYDLCRRAIAFYLEVPYFHLVVGQLGFAAELAAGAEAVRTGDYDARVRSVTDEMVDAIGIAGTPDEVITKLAAYEGVVDRLSLSVPKGATLEETKAHAQLVVDVVASYRDGRDAAA
jgi:alkanesulfonate monooxygenase SsuD/methylene tetrahydromethanopterin reductase-like flavin-dependent oxidoreductase (luciferase family)